MTRQTRLASLLGVGAALLLTSSVYGQPGRPGGPAAPGAPGAPGAPAAPGGAADGGAATVSNETTVTTTTSTDPGITGDFSGDFGAETTAVPRTGGEPLIMTLLGSLTAGGALLLRRKLS